ncbi:hypothetical protein Vau01_123360 [Virgisporangium aurantiacum]|uniref:Uncharacterized protein n=1 Tax=Virgisporangium aurantiacum TaxID=175570 RepID=A0A8J3ZNR8_9ACTN|nr:hypothetical protein Vau01_123360 [Virgisporangium aurantiacum]
MSNAKTAKTPNPRLSSAFSGSMPPPHVGRPVNVLRYAIIIEAVPYGQSVEQFASIRGTPQ